MSSLISLITILISVQLISVQLISAEPVVTSNEMSILTDLCYADIKLTDENLVMAERSLKCINNLMPASYKKCFTESYGVNGFPNSWDQYHDVICKSDNFKAKASLVDECNAKVIEAFGGPNWFKLVHDVARCTSQDF